MCIWSGVSRSRLCQTSFLPFVSFPSLFIHERFTLVEATWCLEDNHPGKWECTLISVMRKVLWDEVLCFQLFCGAMITPWCGARCTDVFCVLATRGHRFGGGGFAVLFFIRALVSCCDVISCSCSNVVHFRVRDYFLWCVSIVPTWNLVWGSRLCFLSNLFFLPPFYLTSIPSSEQSLTSLLRSSQQGCSLQLYKRSWSPQSYHYYSWVKEQALRPTVQEFMMMLIFQSFL